MFTLTIETENAAFANNMAGEVARILREAADRLEAGGEVGVLRDANGNKVGVGRLSPAGEAPARAFRTGDRVAFDFCGKPKCGTVHGTRYYTSRNNGRTTYVADILMDGGGVTFESVDKLTHLPSD